MKKLIYIILLLVISQLAYSQKIVGDNLGNHTATLDLNMNNHNITGLSPATDLTGSNFLKLLTNNGGVIQQYSASTLVNLYLTGFVKLNADNSFVGNNTFSGINTYTGTNSFSGANNYSGANIFTKDITVAAGAAFSTGLIVGKGGGTVPTNTVIGFQALLNNHGSNSYNGQTNTAIGYQALLNNDINNVVSSAYDNTAIGNQAGNSITTGFENTIIGSTLATSGLTTGYRNTIIGTSSEHITGLTTGYSNTIIGANISGLSSALNNNIILSDGDGVVRLKIDASGIPFFSGLTSINPLATDASGKIINGTISDSTLKIADGTLNSALDKVMRLKPRYYYWKTKSGMDTSSRQLGFFAQEVNTALGNEVAPKPDKSKNQKYYGIQDRAMIAYLTKAIQEQQQQIEALKQEILLLKNK